METSTFVDFSRDVSSDTKPNAKPDASLTTNSAEETMIKTTMDNTSRLAEGPRAGCNPTIDDSAHEDNISDDVIDDAAYAAFIQELENASLLSNDRKTVSGADLYMLQAGASSPIEYWDEIDAYNENYGTLKGIGNSLERVGNQTPILVGQNASYGTRSNNPDFSQWYKKDTARPTKHYTYSSYVDEPSNIESAIDTVGDRVDAIYECIKSVDQQVNDLYEKSLSVGDSIDDLQEAARARTLREENIENRLKHIEFAQAGMEAKMAGMLKYLEVINNTLQAIKRDTAFTRYGYEEQ